MNLRCASTIDLDVKYPRSNGIALGLLNLCHLEEPSGDHFDVRSTARECSAGIVVHRAHWVKAKSCHDPVNIDKSDDYMTSVQHGKQGR